VQKKFQLLERTIKKNCSTDPVYYLANPGNWGDALIRHGTKVFFKQKGIKYSELVLNKDLELVGPDIDQEGTLIFGGGGAWCKLGNHGYKILTKVKDHFKKIIVLPSTYEGTFSIPNATFFCRDSYQSKKNLPSALFCHDMAFYIGKISSIEGSGTGNFFRIEAESSKKMEIPADNIDLSLRGTHFSEIGPFFEHIVRYSTIHTDRLHVAIASCLLGKEVHLYPGSYFKNKAIYLSSMRGYYPKVHFHDI
jgi:exopolysaccharide biosynthesis predicted pyruvyltransferase EpsI